MASLGTTRVKFRSQSSCMTMVNGAGPGLGQVGACLLDRQRQLP